MTIRDFLSECNLDKRTAEQIICSVLKIDISSLIVHPETEINQEDLNRLYDIVRDSENGKPLAYILESRFFFHNEFYTPQGVLIPQPDTETLVEQAILTAKSFSDKTRIDILDMCAGTGCIGISVAKELVPYFSEIYLTLSDISEKAYEVFSVNVDNLISEKNIHVNKVLGNLFENINGKYNLILSNPPYIKTSVIPTLEREVQAEPLLALDGGEDGLNLITKIICESRKYAEKNACMLMEIGYDQGIQVTELFRQNFFHNVQLIRDLGMRDRVVKGFF